MSRVFMGLGWDPAKRGRRDGAFQSGRPYRHDLGTVPEFHRTGRDPPRRQVEHHEAVSGNGSRFLTKDRGERRIIVAYLDNAQRVRHAVGTEQPGFVHADDA